MKQNKKLDAMLESAGYEKGTDVYESAYLEAQSIIDKTNADLSNILNPDFDTDPEKPSGSFDKVAEKALDTGKKNTVKKGVDTKDVSNDVEADKKATEVEKGDFEKAAEAGQQKGQDNTLGKAKNTLKVLLTECEKHAEFITYVRSYNDGTPERSAYIESRIDSFVADHRTDELMTLTKNLFESVNTLEADTEE
jgi:hypothetical protein